MHCFFFTFITIRVDLPKTVVDVPGVLKVCDSGICNRLRNQSKIKTLSGVIFSDLLTKENQ